MSFVEYTHRIQTSWVEVLCHNDWSSSWCNGWCKGWCDGWCNDWRNGWGIPPVRNTTVDRNVLQYPYPTACHSTARKRLLIYVDTLVFSCCRRPYRFHDEQEHVWEEIESSHILFNSTVKTEQYVLQLIVLPTTSTLNVWSFVSFFVQCAHLESAEIPYQT